MKNVAVVLAGGVGSRLNARIPKQFLSFGGKTVLEHTVEAFEHHPEIDEIAIVAAPVYHDRISAMAGHNGWQKVRRILPSGKERYDSSLSAIHAYSGEPECNLIFHDGVRPMVSDKIISAVIEALKEHEAVDVAIQSSDTILQVDSEGFIKAIPDRRTLRRSQTPQAFRLSVISEAYRNALRDPQFTATDDCGVVVRYLPDTKIKVVAGEESNMKLTYPEDLIILERLLGKINGDQG